MLVDVIETRDLDEPADIVGIELVVDDPPSQLVPLIALPAIDADPPLAVLGCVS